MPSHTVPARRPTPVVVGRPRVNGELPDDDERAQITLTGIASAFAAGAEVVIVAPGYGSGQRFSGNLTLETFAMLANEIGTFRTAEWESDSAVRFDLADGVVAYVLWEEAVPPSSVTGPVRQVTYLGEESMIAAAEVAGDLPLLVITGG